MNMSSLERERIRGLTETAIENDWGPFLTIDGRLARCAAMQVGDGNALCENEVMGGESPRSRS
jgi:hypothetical protein